MTTRERPILFSGQMVRAILEGRKTQTRRVVKPQPTWIENSGRWNWPLPKKAIRGSDFVCTASREWWEYLPEEAYPCNVGQHLWVRETWQTASAPASDPSNIPGFVFRADGELGCKWCPSIYMPRYASRITLEITQVLHVERLQDIDPRDCIEEGIDFKQHECGCEVCARSTKLCPATSSSLILAYAELWDSINRKTHPWESNPWVWVITFKRTPEAPTPGE